MKAFTVWGSGLALIILAGCPAGVSSVQIPPELPPAPPVDPPDDPEDPAWADVKIGEHGPSGPPPVCSDLPPKPTTWTYHEWIETSEEFAFDAEGNMVNVSDSVDGVFVTPYGGPPQLITTYSGIEIAGTRFMDEDHLVVADEWEGALIQVGMDGSKTPLLGGLNSPNSVAVHENGVIYTTAFDKIFRFDPVTLESAEIMQMTWSDLDGLVFSNDYSTLYFNHDSGGTVGEVVLDANGDADDIAIIKEFTAGFTELDGMTVDVCGGLYVLYTNGQIHRVNPATGASELFIELDGQGWGGPYTTAVNFGSGLGGFASDNLYVMDRDGGLFEIEVGIEGRVEPHYP